MSSRPIFGRLPSRRGILAAGVALGSAGRLLPARAALAAETVTFEGLYKSFGVLGLEFSDRIVALKDRAVRIEGYMAPPLKPESDFFVLTREPLAICPFCQSDADWPLDIVVVYLRGVSPLVSAGSRVAVSGRLELGSFTDGKTGFVSQLRVVDAAYGTA